MTPDPADIPCCSADVEAEVLRRYAEGAAAVQPALCCPTAGYDPQYLRNVPREIAQKDYGCGDPSKYARPGDTVVDLGSGAGKICYILAQKVGPTGNVIGVDFNDAMLDLARRYQDEVAATIGYRNTRFVKARIQDLATDLDNPGAGPLIGSGGVDLVVSNCVLNLVRPADKRQLFAEIHRVLKIGGRAVISDIVCDRDVTPTIMNDPEMWSGCIAGAFREDLFPAMFKDAGFMKIEVLARSDEPWRVIDGVAFRSVTISAWKGRARKDVPCCDPATGCC